MSREIVVEVKLVRPGPVNYASDSVSLSVTENLKDGEDRQERIKVLYHELRTQAEQLLGYKKQSQEEDLFKDIFEEKDRRSSSTACL